MRTEVHKFGGTSVGSAERIAAAARLVQAAAADGGRIAVVTSALSGVTDTLLAAAGAAATGDADRAMTEVAALSTRHHDTLAALATPPPGDVAAGLDRLLDELRDILRAVHLVGELTPRVRDRIVATGEKLAVRLLALALRTLGTPAVALDADTFLETDGDHGSANPLSGVADRTIVHALGPLLDAGTVPVVTGFCGRGPDGATTTLGRGGSDLSATVLAAALDADAVVIWTDVPGVFSADPRLVPEARVIPQLNYREAAELSYYGAKVLHQRTMIPVADRSIPVWTRSSLEPDRPGTLVDASFTPGSHPVKGISAVRDQALVSIEGKGMAGVPGVAARVFGALADRGVSVTMISQSSSESSICLAVPAAAGPLAERALKRALRPELSRGDIEEIAVRQGVCLVAAVGLGMAHHAGIAARVFGACGQRGISVLAIAQGSSELNVTLAVDEADVAEAIRGLHREFGLHRRDTGEDAEHRFDVVLLGCGRIGRALIDQIRTRSHHVFERFGLDPRIVAIADRTAAHLDPTGLDPDRLDALLDAKAAGTPLAGLPGALPLTAPEDLVRHAAEWRLVRPVLVDVTDADTHRAWLSAFEAGFDVVTANKVPLAGPHDRWLALKDTAGRAGRLLRAEATVGAGLPVIDTLDVLVATGDRLTSAVGCFSGTLGFLMTRLEEGARFSEAVREAWDAGYTEPDPVVDLSGVDVARKALILARAAGLADARSEVRLTGLVPDGWAGLPRADLLARLATLDDAFAARVATARERGQVLRFVARVDADGIVVGPEAVDADSPVGRLRGTDNLVVFTSERYDDRPLVVSGPGAGVHVTAMGVLGDLLRLAAERR